MTRALCAPNPGRIFVPLAPAGHRTRPPRAMMQVMMVHELLHAAGLRAHNNAMDDIMTGQMEDGRGGKVHPWGDSAKTCRHACSAAVR